MTTVPRLPTRSAAFAAPPASTALSRARRTRRYPTGRRSSLRSGDDSTKPRRSSASIATRPTELREAQTGAQVEENSARQTLRHARKDIDRTRDNAGETLDALNRRIQSIPRPYRPRPRPSHRSLWS